MCLLSEMSWVKECCNLNGGGILSHHSEYFSHAENLELFFFKSLVKIAFVDKIIRGNIYYNLFYQLVVKY